MQRTNASRCVSVAARDLVAHLVDIEISTRFEKKRQLFRTHKFLEHLRYACKRAICARSEMALKRVHACLGVHGEKGQKEPQTIEALAVSLRARLHQNARGAKCHQRMSGSTLSSTTFRVAPRWSSLGRQHRRKAQQELCHRDLFLHHGWLHELSAPNPCD